MKSSQRAAVDLAIQGLGLKKMHLTKTINGLKSAEALFMPDSEEIYQVKSTIKILEQKREFMNKL